MPEPTFRKSEGKVISKDADPSEVITEERQIAPEEMPTEEPVASPASDSTRDSDARGYGQEDDGRPVFGSGSRKRGCLALRIVRFAIIAGAVILLACAAVAIYYFFYSRHDGTF